jgi:hypothetical protein
MEAKKIKKLVITRETVKDLKVRTNVKTGSINTAQTNCTGITTTSTFSPKPLTAPTG